MAFFDIIAGILFIVSSGFFFNERFRKNWFAVGVAGTIAVVSTYFLTQQMIEIAISEHLRNNPSVTNGSTQQKQDAPTASSSPKAAPATAPPVTTPHVSNQLVTTPRAAECVQTAAAREEPIRALFSAWLRLDPSMYKDQWMANAIQYYGNGNSRTLTEIEDNRATMMRKLASVTVEKMEINSTGYSNNRAGYRVSYAMTFAYKSGRVLPDSNEESYVVICDTRTGRWKIAQNDDRK